MPSQKKQKLTTKDYERLGRTLESIFEGGYVNPWRVYRINMLRGVFFGFGSVIGGTIIITVLLWLLSAFTEFPIIGDIAETFRSSIGQQ